MEGEKLGAVRGREGREGRGWSSEERGSQMVFYMLSSSFQLCPPSAFHPPLMMEGGKKEWAPLPHQTNAVQSNRLRTVSNSLQCHYRASEVVSWWGLALSRCPSSAQRCLMGLICRVLFRLINFFPNRPFMILALSTGSLSCWNRKRSTNLETLTDCNYNLHPYILAI